MIHVVGEAFGGKQTVPETDDDRERQADRISGRADAQERAGMSSHQICFANHEVIAHPREPIGVQPDAECAPADLVMTPGTFPPVQLKTGRGVLEQAFGMQRF